MAIVTTKYKVFVSCTSEMSTYVNLIKQQLFDVSILTKSLGFEFDLWHWFSDVNPEVTSEAQASINEQTKDSDIVISLIGSVLGTPTKKHESGTAEEIHEAIFKSEDTIFGKHSLMVLFKKISVSGGVADFEKAIEVAKYKEKIGNKVIHKEFIDEEDLKLIILKYFSTIIKIATDSKYNVDTVKHNFDIDANKLANNDELEGNKEVSVVEESIDGIGLIELRDDFSVSIEKASNAISAIGGIMELMTEDMNLVSNSSLSPEDAVDILSSSFDNGASQLSKYSKEVSNNYVAAVEIFEDILVLMGEDFSDYNSESEKQEFINQMENGVLLAEEYLNAVASARQSMTDLPRLSVKLNKSKNRLLRSLDDVYTALNLVKSKSQAVVDQYR